MNFKIVIFFFVGLNFVFGNNINPTSDTLIDKKIKSASKFSQLEAKISFKKAFNTSQHLYLKPSSIATPRSAKSK